MNVEMGQMTAAMATWDNAIEQFEGNPLPKLEMHYAQALANKAIIHGYIGEISAMIATCDKMISTLKDSNVPETKVEIITALRIKMEAFIVQQDLAAAVEMFRSVYTMYIPGHETMMRQILEIIMELVVANASERELIDILASDSEKADTILPLVIALRQRACETVRAPTEFLEVAADVREQLDGKDPRESWL